MARIKIECLEEDKPNIVFFECPFNYATSPCKGIGENCKECINENVEFVIKEEE